jgi:hypothetical protein
MNDCEKDAALLAVRDTTKRMDAHIAPAQRTPFQLLLLFSIRASGLARSTLIATRYNSSNVPLMSGS